MNRFELLTTLKDTLNDNLIVCNIGLPSQELYKIQDMPNLSFKCENVIQIYHHFIPCVFSLNINN